MAGDLDIVGSAAVDVVPIAPNFHNKLKAIVLPAADRVGEDAGRRMGDAISRHITISIPDAINQGGRTARVAASRQGDNAGGAFASSLRRKLEAAFKAMPKLDVRLSDTGVDAELARIRAKLEQLSNKRIGIDVGAEEARAEAQRLEEQLQRLGANHPNVRIRVDTAAARAALAAFREEIDAATAPPGQIRLEVDGSFGAKLRAAVAEAQASLPNINVGADTSNARAELQRLREQMAALGEARVGIDIDAATARAQIDDIRRRLEILSIQRHDIDVRVDAARAAAQLAALDAEADGLKLIRFTAIADTSQAEGALMRLTIALGVVAAIPIAPPIVAGIGAIAAAATAAGAGIGALALAAVPAIKGVTAAIQAKSAADKESATATDNSAAAAKRGAQAALQMESAQQSLASAHRQAARQIEQADRAIEDAERGVQDAKRNVADAERAVADAAQRAADQRRQAADAVERAERSLADAQRQELQAQRDLTQARKDAAAELKALDDKLTDGKLSQRDAALRVKEAEEELNATRARYDAGTASALDLERAQLGYEQAVQAAKEQAEAYKQLQVTAVRARMAGVDGNDAVKQAADRLADAQRNVQDQTKAVADAQQQAARTQVEAAQTVADAQRRVTDAMRAQEDAQRRVADAVRAAADVQVQAADSIRSAERGVESARLSGIDTTAQATTKADAYRKAIADLTPEQRKLYDSIAGPNGLTNAFKAWSKSLQPDVLPLFTRGVDGAKASLPGLTPLVTAAADAVGILFDKASKSLKSPFWQGFKDDIEKSAKPAIVGLGVSFGNVLAGMAGIVDAFLPHMDGISATMQRITKRFADWGKGLKGSPEFEHFLQYVKDTSPGVAEFLGDLLRTALDVAQALAPMSQVAMDILTPLLDGLSWLANNAPWSIQILWGLYAAFQAIKLMTAGFAAAMMVYQIAVAGATLVTSGWAAALQATGIVPLIEAIVLAIAALVVGIIWAYKNVGWFRTAVDAAWGGIKTATLFLWNSVLKPTFAVIWSAIKTVGDICVWLWKNVFVPAWNAISLVARIAAAIILTVVIAPIVIGVQLLGKWIGWLWANVWKPTFKLIGDLAVWTWNNVLKPFFNGFWNTIKWVGDKFVWLYNNAIKPATGWIADKAKWLYENALKPFFSGFWNGLKWVGDKFKWLYDHSVGPVAGWISDKASWLYNKGLKPAFDKIKSAVALVGDAFGLAKDAIGKAWGKVSDIAKKPVNFIIEWVYTKGIKAVWDKVADFVHLDHLPKAPKLLAAGGTVGDGWGVARPLKTNRPTAIVGEGNPRYPEYVIPTDPKYRSRAVALHRQAGTQLLESGGVIGKAWDWTKDTVSDVIGTGIDWAKTGADLMLHPGKVWDALVKPVMSKVQDGVGDYAKWGEAIGRYPGKMVTGLKDLITNAVASMFAGGSGGGQWIKPVNVPFGTRFGVAGPMWSSGHHTGLDFPAPVGTPIHAVASGTVSGVGIDGPYGNHLEINHGGGLQSMYAHMSKMLVGLNQVVAQGDVIGKVGATGNTTGPHLHLEARVNGKPVDPMPYLTAPKAGTKIGQAIASAKQFAKSQLHYFGWGPDQFPALERLWEGESGWRWNAENPSSGAYGIPQALPASRMASAGPDWRTNPATQILWGLRYIKDRPDYGSPSAAYSKWLSRMPHWYDEGGYLPPGLSLVANGTGSPEPVFTGSQWEDIKAAKNSGPTEINVEARVFVGDREITDIVRTEIHARDSVTASSIRAGRLI